MRAVAREGELDWKPHVLSERLTTKFGVPPSGGGFSKGEISN